MRRPQLQILFPRQLLMRKNTGKIHDIIIESLTLAEIRKASSAYGKNKMMLYVSIVPIGGEAREVARVGAAHVLRWI